MTADAWARAGDVRAGRVSPVELVEESLAAIARLDPEIGAFTVVLADEARATARAVDARVADGEPVGPLAGVPVAIKDHIWMRGAPATNGSHAFAGFVPDEDCACVARLRAAGAVFVGKTNNPEFCYRGITDNDVFGLTRNPWALEHTPGGSSGGSGAAVAAGMVPLAVGTDGGGSIRIPASFCGIAGLKPTFGLVPKEPGFRDWRTLSVDGPLARTVRDLALMLSVMAGPSPPTTRPVAVPPGDLLAAARRRVRGCGSPTRPISASPRSSPTSARLPARRSTARRAGAGLVEAAPPTRRPDGALEHDRLPEGLRLRGAAARPIADRMTAGTAEIVRAGRRSRRRSTSTRWTRAARYTRAWAGSSSASTCC